MKHRVLRLTLTVLVAAHAGASFARDDDDRRPKCSNATFQGAYSFYELGFASGMLPIADVGILKADGAGHFTGSETLQANGTTLQDSFQNGTYQVNADCTGTAQWTAVFPGYSAPRTVSFSIMSQGDEINILSTSPGTTAVGVAKRQ